MNANVMYTPNPPAGKSSWSQAPSAKLKVGSGTTPLNWSIQVVPASAGTIVFSTTAAAPGVQFTGTGTNAWPGAIPTGDATEWTSSITNNLPPGANKVPYPYVVHAIYTPAGGTPVAIVYDPEVEADPPSIAVG